MIRELEDVTVLASINLNLLEACSEKELFLQLSKLQKPAFNDYERIVFYCIEPLQHTYTNLPANLLIRLQKMLVYVDIPNFFCVIISTMDLSAELKDVCNNYAVDESPIKNIVSDKVPPCLE